MMAGGPPARISGFAEIADLYDGFLFDVWGTVYDGGDAFPDVIALLRALKEKGKRVVFLSNSPQLAPVVVERLARIGISPDLHDGAVTSGGETNRLLREGADGEMARFSGPVYQFAPDRCPETLPRDGYEAVGRIEDAAWILNAAPNGVEETVEDYTTVMESGLARGLPMLVANPDRLVFNQGALHVCAGALGEWYAARGGTVLEIGKPHPGIFERCRMALSLEEHHRIAMVGDNLATDILGANRAGLGSVLVTAGIHKLSKAEGGLDLDRLATLEAEHGARADHVIEQVAW